MKISGGCHCGNISYEAEIDPDTDAAPERPSTSDLLSRLEQGEMNVKDVLAQLRAPKEGTRS